MKGREQALRVGSAAGTFEAWEDAIGHEERRSEDIRREMRDSG